ncbi:MAG: proton extrusion protein PcxA [Calothrix sp. C42_A2020_038]|nr:proton extrusion protein PcxA [Calothrix sp. C42_A2020_038]
MNNLSVSQKVYEYLVSLYKWYLRTPERSLDEAYQAALYIKKIEDEHFNGNPINIDPDTYSTVNEYFESELRKQLKIIRMRLAEFNSSRFFLNESNQKGSKRYGVELLNPEQVLAKLKVIDEISAKYNNFEQNREIEIPPAVVNTEIIQAETAFTQPRLRNIEIRESNQPRGKTNTTGVLPRSILGTIGRLQVELDPNAEQDVVQNFRKAQRRTIISVRFILLLIIIPILTHQLSKAFVVGPIVDHFRNHEAVAVFINRDMEEEALIELQRFEEKIKFQSLIGVLPPMSDEETEVKVQEKARELADKYRVESASAIKNVFSDIMSVISFTWLLMVSKREIAVLKEFFDHVVYGLSDSAKAFIIILFTDIFVGFHSPHGWEVILEGISRHWGLPESHSFIFLFIATFPVILDTIFKYWIFRYLNRVSPSAVATYHNMNE